MNKDVIYVEPEDDITDIINKIEGSKEKIVALVPPKKASVFRSIVNIKLINKSGFAADKNIVLVTTDPSIIKLAAAVKLPVTKDLQTAPEIPSADKVERIETESTEKVDENGEEVKEPEEDKDTDEKIETDEKETEADDEKSDGDEIDDEVAKKEDEKDAKKDKKAKKAKKMEKLSDNPVINWIKNHRVITICGCVGFLLLVLIMIWAFAIAPAATITVEIRTTANNFSENVKFTDNLAEENSSEGKFFLVEKKVESKAETTFEATGTKNVGEKASGDVVIYAYFRGSGAIAVDAGSVFTYNGKSYISQKDAPLSWDGKTMSNCDNAGQATSITSGCLVSGRVDVVAEHSGSDYNVSADTSGWSTTADVNVYTDKAIAGGSDKTITVVQKSDIEKAKAKLENTDKEADKEKLFSEVVDGDFPIDSSFKQTISEAVSSPAVGEEVKEGEKAKLTVTTVTSIYVIDKTKVEEFIREKAKLAENYKIYSMNDPFVENFTKTEGGWTGKIKTSYVSGPEVTENKIIEIVKGKGIGTAQHDLKDINGISKIQIDPSFPWVSSIPNNPEKITVYINVEQ